MPCEIYYPADVAGDNVPFAATLTVKVPCISFGHGFVMTHDVYANIRDAVVANGYIIVFPVTEGSLSPSHGEFARDLVFSLRSVAALGATATSVLFNRVDTTTCIMGHSMGGGAAFLAASYFPALDAIVTFSAAETTPSSIGAATAVPFPALVFAGANDCVTPPTAHQLPMYNALSSLCKHYINIKGGSHCQMAASSVTCSFGESTCAPPPAITRAAQHSTINQYLIPWLNYTLKGSCTDGTAFESALAVDTAVTALKNCTLCSIAAVASAGRAATAPVYPNPATDKILISLSYSPATIYLFSVFGKKVYEATIPGNTAIDVAHLPAGVYSYFIAPDKGPELRGTITLQR